jgi:predicted NAD/FAD-binding protein
MGLLDAVKKTPDWQTDEGGCRDRIAQNTAGIARVIVPLCLSLPKKLPKAS